MRGISDFINENFYKNVGAGLWKENVNMLYDAYMNSDLQYGVSLRGKFTMTAMYVKETLILDYYGKKEQHTYHIPLNNPTMKAAFGLISGVNNSQIDLSINMFAKDEEMLKHLNIPSQNVVVKLSYGDGEQWTYSVYIICSYKLSRRSGEEFTLEPYRISVHGKNAEEIFDEKFAMQQID